MAQQRENAETAFLWGYGTLFASICHFDNYASLVRLDRLASNNRLK
jgi:hypothetical protein